MKFEVTHPKIWNKLAEKNLPMKHKIQIYEKLGGAYRCGKDEGEQVFNKMTELVKYRVNEGDESTPEEVVAGLKEMTMGDLERIADYANMIAKRMSEGQELSSWMYSQLTIALENLNSVHDTMDGNDGVREPMKEATTKYFKTITNDEWKKTHKDYKSIINGVHYVMKLDDKYGFSVLAPVKIKD